jgi:hypothetical protein
VSTEVILVSGLGAAGRVRTQLKPGVAGRAITQAGGPARRAVTRTEDGGPGSAGRAISQAGGPARRKIKMPPQSESVEAAGLGGSKNLF